MSRPVQPHLETPSEEIASSVTHGIGAALAVAGITTLISLAVLHGSARHVVTVSIYGVTLLMVYFASTLYHACPGHRAARAKHCLKVVDHVGIYCYIAGTYTPFLLVSLGGAWGWSLFGVLWGLTIFGTAFKLFFVDRYDFVSTMVYLGMGWIGIIAVKPFLEHLPGGAIAWMVAGGLAYTLGVIFYLWDHLPFNHAIWHLFVMAGSACHFFAIAVYVVPR